MLQVKCEHQQMYAYFPQILVCLKSSLSVCWRWAAFLEAAVKVSPSFVSWRWQCWDRWDFVILWLSGTWAGSLGLRQSERKLSEERGRDVTCGADPKSRRSNSELCWDIVVMSLEFPSEPQTGPGQRADCEVLGSTPRHVAALGCSVV